MPQLIAIGLIGGLVWYAWRALKRQMEAVERELDRNNDTPSEARDIQALEKGEDGVYRVRKSDDHRDAA